jgi:hypothetical protein
MVVGLSSNGRKTYESSSLDVFPFVVKYLHKILSPIV